MVAAGKDELFGRPLDRRVELKAPFYAMRFWPKLHYCMGGIGINDQAQVISTKTCKPLFVSSSPLKLPAVSTAWTV